ncbi:hypothetical protein [Roseibium suaedae]|uniref:Uncharacterized protein n=1 Tax=Roseibium suaedae TaxID=735517 RepID=A0A1M7FEE0_9HYPH|nr:hypothetical protein [Roseibium suaedae]SHM02366.1 hypothetical protein SAMN05444272_1588 [Roseibium suaedae]
MDAIQPLLTESGTLDHYVSQLVGRYNKPGGKSAADFSSDDSLIGDLRKELDLIVRQQAANFHIKAFTAVALRAFWILRGKAA